jgi:hypothetical protein
MYYKGGVKVLLHLGTSNPQSVEHIELVTAGHWFLGVQTRLQSDAKMKHQLLSLK